MRTSSRETDPAAVLPGDHPLWSLHDRGLGPYRLLLTEARQLPSSGWKGFRLALIRDGTPGDVPVLAGIHSVGGKGIAPWFDLDYRRVLTFGGKDDGSPSADDDGPDPDGETDGGRPGAAAGVALGPRADLRREELEVPLFEALRQQIPANGHVMVAYEHRQHRESHEGLKQAVPPVATPLGWALWRAGFDGGFKDWHISEGGHEGPKKLQADVPVDAAHRRRAREEARNACEELLRRLPADSSPAAPDAVPGFRRRTRSRLHRILERLGEPPDDG